MAFHQVSASSLTPSRPAPQAPQRKGTTNDTSQQQPLYSTPTALSNSGYGPSFTFTQSSPSASSYAPTYTGIGGTPGRNNSNDHVMNNSQIVRSGPVSVKEDGFASWMWKVKWLILKEQTLTIHKSEVSPPINFYQYTKFAELLISRSNLVSADTKYYNSARNHQH
jgi:serine/threonine-protein kinase CLA4